jgi:saccharopine dehydrogenase (NAD+, L-lysine-forming)
MNKTFLILGGYGNAGRSIAQLLLQETELKLILAGPNLEKAYVCANKFNQKFEGHRVSALRVDVAEEDTLKQALDKVDLVVVASSTVDCVETVAHAALAAQVDYFDIHLSVIEKNQILKSLQPKIEQAGCCFITDGGFHPGMISTLVRYAASYFHQLETAQIASLMQINWKAFSFSEATIAEFTQEIKNVQFFIFQDKKWQKQSWNTYKKFDFGSTFGQRYCIPIFTEELRALPEMVPSLKEVGFYVAGFNWFSDYIAMPLTVTLQGMSKKATNPLNKFFNWSVNTFSKPPYGVILMLEARGWKEGKPTIMQISISHEEPYLLAAIPVVACLLQYLDGSICKPGLWYQANVIDPQRMMIDLERLGITVQIQEQILNVWTSSQFPK